MPYSLPSDTRYILYEETDLAQLKQKPCHFKCGIYLRQLYINLHQLCKNTALYLHLV